jgi:hypothetical protein
VSERYRWVYVGVPLTGTRSMIAALTAPERARAYGISRTKAIPAEFLARHEELRDYRTFSVVRNPWSRAVSCYNKKVLNCNSLAKIYFLSRYHGLRPLMGFREFVEWLVSEEGADDTADPHWLSQWRFLYDGDGEPLYDRIGRLERLGEDIADIFEAYGTPPLTLERRRRSQDMVVKPLYRDYRDYYDDNSRKLVERRYQKDIELFGYTF